MPHTPPHAAGSSRLPPSARARWRAAAAVAAWLVAGGVAHVITQRGASATGAMTSASFARADTAGSR